MELIRKVGSNSRSRANSSNWTSGFPTVHWTCRSPVCFRLVSATQDGLREVKGYPRSTRDSNSSLGGHLEILVAISSLCGYRDYIGKRGKGMANYRKQLPASN